MLYAILQELSKTEIYFKTSDVYTTLLNSY